MRFWTPKFCWFNYYIPKKNTVPYISDRSIKYYFSHPSRLGGTDIWIISRSYFFVWYSISHSPGQRNLKFLPVRIPAEKVPGIRCSRRVVPNGKENLVCYSSGACKSTSALESCQNPQVCLVGPELIWRANLTGSSGFKGSETPGPISSRGPFVIVLRVVPPC